MSTLELVIEHGDERTVITTEVPGNFEDTGRARTQDVLDALASSIVPRATRALGALDRAQQEALQNALDQAREDALADRDAQADGTDSEPVHAAAHTGLAD